MCAVLVPQAQFLMQNPPIALFVVQENILKLVIRNVFYVNWENITENWTTLPRMETVLTAKLENMETNVDWKNAMNARPTKHQQTIVSHCQTVFAKKGLLIVQTVLAWPVRPERLKIRQEMDCAVHARQEK